MPTAATTVMIATVRAGPSRATTTPASGIDTTDPIAIASSTRPRPRGESPSASRTCGMRDAQLANANPLKMKTTYTAAVARRSTKVGDADLIGRSAYGRFSNRRGRTDFEVNLIPQAESTG